MNLQKEYQLIEEGKGNKDHFLKLAKRAFPQYVGTYSTYDQTVQILKGKNLLSEAKAGGVVTSGRKDWFKIFEAEVKAMAKEPNKEVVDLETKDYDYKDEKNIDNLYGTSFLMGYIAEIGDPKNADKTVAEVKEIVAKNMAKDRNYYAKNAAFSIKGIGYTDDAPSLGPTKEIKGKYKSSGYGNE